MSKSGESPTLPKSMRHKQILDVAAENPDASVDALAAEVPSATPELVERVLEEYGDPAGDDEPDMLDAAGNDSMQQEITYPDPTDLTPKQRETLHVILDHPDASQRDLGDLLDVTASTVSNRVNAIEGFDWENREAFAESVVGTANSDAAEPSDAATATGTPDSATGSESAEAGTATEPREPAIETESGESVTATDAAGSAPATESPESATATKSSDTMDTQNAGPESNGEQVFERLSAIEQQLDHLTTTNESDDVFVDPELVHKVVHACMQADTISEDEELQILKSLL